MSAVFWLQNYSPDFIRLIHVQSNSPYIIRMAGNSNDSGMRLLSIFTAFGEIRYVNGHLDLYALLSKGNRAIEKAELQTAIEQIEQNWPKYNSLLTVQAPVQTPRPIKRDKVPLLTESKVSAQLATDLIKNHVVKILELDMSLIEATEHCASIEAVRGNTPTCLVEVLDNLYILLDPDSFDVVPTGAGVVSLVALNHRGVLAFRLKNSINGENEIGKMRTSYG